jgi:hypothetical protein
VVAIYEAGHGRNHHRSRNVRLKAEMKYGMLIGNISIRPHVFNQKAIFTFGSLNVFSSPERSKIGGGKKV